MKKDYYKKNKQIIMKNSSRSYKKLKDSGHYKYGEIGWANRTLASHRYRDKNKNRSICNISVKELLDVIKNPCIYCGDKEDKITLDRIDPTKGHTKDNVVPCCSLCNTARMASFTHEEMKLLGKTIIKIKKNRRSQ